MPEPSLTTLTFDMKPETYPLNETIIVRSDVALFASQLSSIVPSLTDCAFLLTIPFDLNWGGACDCSMHPFVCVPKQPFTVLPTAAEVLSELRITNFQSEHISNLNTAQIPFPGYHPNTKNDEIHTDPTQQYMFAVGELSDEHSEEPPSDIEKQSKGSHEALRAYVLEGHLYYVLAHDKPERYGEDEFSNFVLLFGVGVSPATGNLIGAVTHQACHNLCD
jgi:hypothetical protein